VTTSPDTKPFLRNVWPNNVSLLVVSDVHLKDLEEDNAQTLFGIIREAATLRPEYFILLGDIFDFSLGSNAYYKRKFAKLGEELTALAKTGIKVIFFEGNHEFNVENFGWDGIEFVPEGTRILKFKSGKSVALSHGDLIYSSQVYRRFRSVVKSFPVKLVASFFPGKLLDHLTLKSSELSRAQDKYRTMDHAEILAAAENWLGHCGADDGIFGHFHIPYAEKRRDGNGRILSLDCWEKPNALVLAEDEYYRINIGDRAAKIATSYFSQP
jgi:UDP-2,3-diacylglucosamine hydrolase